jgi:HAD superfamily hydrolase (TIGR01549 family)
MATSFAVIFDLDGTLIDSKALAMAATSAALEQNGFNDLVVDEKSYEYGSRFVTPKRLAWHATGETDKDDECGAVLAISFEKYIADQVTAGNTPLFAGILDMLQCLKQQDNISMGVLSNASASFVHNVITHHQLEDTFEMCCGAEDVPAAKPEPDGLNAMLHQLQVPPPHCIYVGDSPTDGMAAANANIYGIGVSWGNNSHSQLKTHFNEVVSSVSELQLALETFFEKKSKTLKISTPLKVESKTTEEIPSDQTAEPRRRVSWQCDVVDNEHMNKMKTDDEFWDGR